METLVRCSRNDGAQQGNDMVGDFVKARAGMAGCEGILNFGRRVGQALILQVGEISFEALMNSRYCRRDMSTIECRRREASLGLGCRGRIVIIFCQSRRG